MYVSGFAAHILLAETYWNMDDTLTDDRYYSNSGARNNIEKKGRNFVGAYYSTYENDSFVRK